MNPDILLIVLTVMCSAFFSGAEVAVVSVSMLKARHLVSENVKNSKSLLYLKEHANKTLITILIGNNIMNVASSALATKIALEIFDNKGIGIATGIMTFVILTFGEITPKTFVANNYEKVALFIAPLLIILIKILYPFVMFFDWLSRIINKLLGSSHIKPLVTEKDIKYLVKVGEEEGAINTTEKQIIHKTFALNDINVNKIKTPFDMVFSLDWNMTIDEAAGKLLDNRYSRVPVFDKHPEDIKGIVILSDVFNAIHKGKGSSKLKIILSPVYFVSWNKKIDFLLNELQVRNSHMAMILDSKRRVIGLVTIEDILEEIVGEIFDEADKVENLIRHIGDNSWLIRGKTYIRTINKKLNVNLPITNEFKPVSKFLEERIELVKGNEFLIKDEKVVLKIHALKNNKVSSVLLKKL